jgi:hypothetical protein
MHDDTEYFPGMRVRTPAEAKSKLLALSFPEPNSGCWLWMGTVTNNGRPHVLLGTGRLLTAYRVAYEFFVGPIPDGMFVCHRCDVPICVNPDHLFLGTHADNMADMARKGRGAKPTGGKRLGRELTAKMVRLVQNGHPVISVAKRFGVTNSAVRYHLNKGPLKREFSR